ncbi:MAG: YggS family pyridoxal phosphate-dependent enzyme [Desulfovibrionaceae bacterium]|nr:YggS family pyridoxal phosphate-dependent enzyme [Desulfovibrionaceae bacterium]
MSQESLCARYTRVLESIDVACARFGRDATSVQLLAVSKFHTVEAIFALQALGQRVFGENYVQEALAKMQTFAAKGLDPKASFHLIGHVQSRKASSVAGRFALIHTLDSKKLATALEKQLALQNMLQDVLIEVNIAKEPQKNGVKIEDLRPLVAHLKEQCPHIKLQGLMCMPPFAAQGELARPYFASLRGLKEELEAEWGSLPHLSMGMSSDFPWAIAEGATIVRIGTAIFGPRPKQERL